MARRNKKNPKDEFLWVEKYRPQSLADCILPDDLRAKMQALIDKGELTNLLFAGGPGIGKTTVAKAICNDLNMDALVINASKDGNIDTLRTTIQNFAMTKSFEGKKKVVILDEADYLNPNSTQPALRNFIEEFSKNCRFIFTCNYPKKIIEPLHSRLTAVEFTFSKAEQKKMAGQFMKRFCTMLDAEGVTYDKPTLAQLILKYTPDYRKMINELQGVTGEGNLAPEAISSMSGDQFEELAEWIAKKQFTQCREWVAENVDVGFTHFMKVRNALESKLQKSSIPDMFQVLSEYDRGAAWATDMEVHFTSCITSLMFDLEYQ